MQSNPRILCFSDDPHLLQTRRWILETRYEAVCVSSLQEMEQQTPADGFDVVILCHSLTPKDCESATQIVRRRWPLAKIVALASEWADCELAGSDKVVASNDGPIALLSAVEQMLTPRQMLPAVA
jgi:DNA-binding response OmpR family regulator